MNRNLTPWALGAIGVLLVAGFLRFIPLGFAVVGVVVVVLAMSEIRKRENRARHEEQLRQWQAQNPNPQDGWVIPPASPRPPRSAWSAAGTLLAATAALGGLVLLAGVVMLVVALSSGNFKLGNK